MAITADERLQIVNQVLSAIRTNSLTIDQLTPVLQLSDTDKMEINGGKSATFEILKKYIGALSEEDVKTLINQFIEQTVSGSSVKVPSSKAVKEVMSVAEGAQSNSTDALETAKGAMKIAGNALTVAEGAQSEAESAKSQAERAESLGRTATNLVGALSDRVDGVENRVDGVYKNVALLGKVVSRVERDVVPSFDRVVDKVASNVMESGKIDVAPGIHIEVVWDRSRGRFVLLSHGDENHPDSGDAYLNWSSLAEEHPELPLYSDFCASDGNVRTDRAYRSGSSLYRVVAAQGDGVASLVEIGAKEALLIDMWEKRWRVNGISFGYYDYSAVDGHPFVGNDLRMTYDEALDIMDIARIHQQDSTTATLGVYPRNVARTLPPVLLQTYTSAPIYGLFYLCSHLEIARIMNLYSNDTNLDSREIAVTSTREAFYGCKVLREVRGVLKMPVTDTQNQHFYNCTTPALTTIWIKGLSLSMRLLDESNKIKYECLRFMVDNAANTSAITVTVHEEIFDALSGGGAPMYDNGGSDEEWTQLMKDAVAKNISFASA